jgi:DNA-binding CsgD family transcriptional regulator
MPPSSDPVVAGRKEPVVLLARRYAQARGFSERETAVFLLFAIHNRTNKEIAAELGIGYSTVKVYWTRIFRKLGCNDAAGATLGLLQFALGFCPRCHRDDDTIMTA